MTTHDPELVELVGRVLEDLYGNDLEVVARTVLDAITTSPRHALVELPEPDYRTDGDEYENGFVEWAYPHGSVSTTDDGTVMWGHCHITDPEKVRYAGSCLLAAARHAESTAPGNEE